MVRPQADDVGASRQRKARLLLPGATLPKKLRNFGGLASLTAAGGELTLLGETKEDRRPVKQLVHVKMKVGGGKPRAIVEPPPTAK